MTKRAHTGSAMPPKKKQKQAEQSDDEQDDRACLVLHERVSQDRLYTVAMLFIDNPEDDRTVMTYFDKYSASRMSRMPVVYKPSKNAPLGRLYAQGPSMQNIPGWVRRLVLPKGRNRDIGNAFDLIPDDQGCTCEGSQAGLAINAISRK